MPDGVPPPPTNKAGVLAAQERVLDTARVQPDAPKSARRLKRGQLLQCCLLAQNRGKKSRNTELFTNLEERFDIILESTGFLGADTIATGGVGQSHLRVLD